jgi:hypothetical protein
MTLRSSVRSTLVDPRFAFASKLTRRRAGALFVSATAAGSLLVACGGGGGSPASPSDAGSDSPSEGDSGSAPQADAGREASSDGGGDASSDGAMGASDAGAIDATPPVGGNWIWVGGPDYVNDGSDDAGTPSAREAPAVWQDAAGNVWMLGGNMNSGGTAISDDFWEYSSGQWSCIHCAPAGGAVYGTKGTPSALNYPGGRVGAASWVDPAGNFWLFGGYGTGAPQLNDAGVSVGDAVLNDLWEYLPSQKAWVWVSGDDTFLPGSFVPLPQKGVYGTRGVPSPSNVPGGRSFAARWVDASGKLWLFGGQDGAISISECNDLWSFAQGEWTWVGGQDVDNDEVGVYGTQGSPDPANIPPARDSAATWVDAAGNFWLFGGQSNNGSGFNDLWRYDPMGGAWTWVSGSNGTNKSSVFGTQGQPSPSNVPGGRAGASAWADAAGNFWIFGGESGGPGEDFLSYYNDLWVYGSGEWTWMGGPKQVNGAGHYGTQGVADPLNVPGTRYSAAAWTGAAGDFFLFGGNGSAATASTGVVNDLWKYVR